MGGGTGGGGVNGGIGCNVGGFPLPGGPEGCVNDGRGGGGGGAEELV